MKASLVLNIRELKEDNRKKLDLKRLQYTESVWAVWLACGIEKAVL